MFAKRLFELEANLEKQRFDEDWKMNLRFKKRITKVDPIVLVPITEKSKKFKKRSQTVSKTIEVNDLDVKSQDDPV